MGTLYCSRYELVFALKNGTAPHINTFDLGQRGCFRTNVWPYRGMNAFGNGRDAGLAVHPIIKPVAIIADAIKDASGRGGIVLDLFGGSGSTLVAAHKHGRTGNSFPFTRPPACNFLSLRLVQNIGQAMANKPLAKSTVEIFRPNSNDNSYF